VPHEVQEGLVDPRRLFASLSDRDVEAGLAQYVDPAPVYGWKRVSRGNVDDTNPSGENRVGARWGAAVVAARLEGDVKGGAVGSARGSTQSNDLGVMRSGWLGRSLADDQAVFDDDGSYRRIWARPPNRAIGQLERARHEVHKCLPRVTASAKQKTRRQNRASDL
jgi:hypothetical protein